MSTFTRNEPVAGDDLDISQPKLVANTNASDDAFGTDHYAFSNTTPQRGFHNTVTTPLILAAAHPATTTNPILYAMSDTPVVGTIQYSRGPSNAVPTPLTTLSGGPVSLINGATQNILDLTDITLIQGVVYIFEGSTTAPTSTTPQVCSFNGTKMTALVEFIGIANLSAGSGFRLTFAANVLQISNQSGHTLTNVYWTIQLMRIVT